MNNKFEDVTYTSNTKAWRYIFRIMLKEKKILIFMFIALVFTVILDVTLPLLNEYSIKTFFESTDPNRFSNIYGVLSAYIIFTILYFISVFFYIRLACLMETRVSYRLRKEAYTNLQKVSFSYFDKTAQGWIMARMTSDTRTLSTILSWGLVDFAWGVLLMISILIILLIQNPLLALIIIVLCPIMLGFTIFVRKYIFKAYRQAKKINSEITASLSESIMGNKTAKTLVIEDDNKKEFNALTHRYKKNILRAARISSTFGPVVFILGYIGVATILYSGGYMILNDIKIFGKVLTISGLYLFVDYTIKFFDPIMMLNRFIGDIQQASASAERIVALIKEDNEVKDTEEIIEKYGDLFNPKYENYENLFGDIEFQNVSFKYNTGDTILDEFNIKIRKGKSVALVGHTGSGKSTIVNLISRFYEPTEGTILIDGIDYKDRSIGWLHSNLGYVLQSPQLFSGTIKENVMYGKLDATLDEVIKACKLVNAHDFIVSLDKGYDSLVGEGGSKLSLGERQLISFARAIISNPKILILDEATSSIDTKTENKIKDAIHNVLNGRTCFLIAHRLSTIVSCDLIIVLDKGKILEKGSHQELLDKRGSYYDLYQNQFQKQ
ncbi:MAG: ABC transporter ATP-binding protein [Anaeroplasmataceae bacterium]